MLELQAPKTNNTARFPAIHLRIPGEVPVTRCSQCGSEEWFQQEDHRRRVVSFRNGRPESSSSWWKETINEPNTFRCRNCARIISEQTHEGRYRRISQIADSADGVPGSRTCDLPTSCWLNARDEAELSAATSEVHFYIAGDKEKPVLKARRKAFLELEGKPILPMPNSLHGHVWTILENSPKNIRKDLRWYRDFYPVSARTAYAIVSAVLSIPGNPLLDPRSDVFISMSEIANAAGVHESTVHRVSSWIRVAPLSGPPDYLRDLLVQRNHTYCGKSAQVSSHKVKEIVRNIITAYEKRPSDQHVSDLLKAQHGLNVARRTVSKYRHQIAKELSIQTASHGDDALLSYLAPHGITASDELLLASEQTWDELWKNAPTKPRDRLAELRSLQYR